MNGKNTSDYLYEHERENLEKREKIAAALACGWTYERIQREMGVGASTISAVKRMARGKESNGV